MEPELFFFPHKVGSDLFCHQSSHLFRNWSSVLFAWLLHFTAPYSSGSSISQPFGGIWKAVYRGKLIGSNRLKWSSCTKVFILSTECLVLKSGGRQNYWVFTKYAFVVFLSRVLSCYLQVFHFGVKIPHGRRLLFFWNLYFIG